MTVLSATQTRTNDDARDVFFVTTGGAGTFENYSEQFSSVLLGHVWRGRSHRQRDGVH